MHLFNCWRYIIVQTTIFDIERNKIQKPKTKQKNFTPFEMKGTGKNFLERICCATHMLDCVYVCIRVNLSLFLFFYVITQRSHTRIAYIHIEFSRIWVSVLYRLFSLSFLIRLSEFVGCRLQFAVTTNYIQTECRSHRLINIMLII